MCPTLLFFTLLRLFFAMIIMNHWEIIEVKSIELFALCMYFAYEEP